MFASNLNEGCLFIQGIQAERMARLAGKFRQSKRGELPPREPADPPAQ